jgi:type I restriction enzyme S subunit
VGRTCVVPENVERALITKHVYRISVDQRLVLPYYLMNALRGSEAVLEQMGANIRGHTRPGINGEILKRLFVPIAPIQEQHEILRRLSFNLAWLQGMATEFARAVQLLPKLDQAILAKAFRGELVPQELSDEPGSELLARIRAAKGKQPNRRRVRKPRHDMTPRAPRERTAMTKSRYDNDVKEMPYLADLLRQTGGPASAEDLFRLADLPVADFYKQLKWEVDGGHIRDDNKRLEAA